MPTTISKSHFRANALTILRDIERSGKPVIITDRGTPVLTVTPYRADPATALRTLRKTVVRFDAPTRPVGDDWDSGTTPPASAKSR